MLDDNRVVHSFDWGTEYITTNANGSDPRKLFGEYSKKMVTQSDEFFYAPEISDFKFQISDFRFQISDLESAF